MSLESSIADLTRASTELTATVRGKTGEIDAKVAAKLNELEVWRTGARAEMALPFRNVIEVGGDANTFYPVPMIIRTGAEIGRFVIQRHYGAKHPESLGATHVAGLLLELSIRGAAWGDFSLTRIENYQFSYHQSVGGLINFFEGRIIWLRGGGMEYHIDSDVPYYKDSFAGTENLKPILLPDTPLLPGHDRPPFAGGGYKVSPKTVADAGWDAHITLPKVI